MIFASFEFLLLFLPLYFACYFAAPFRFKNHVIAGFSWAFYAWWRVDFLALLLAVTGVTFLLARAMDAAGRSSPRARLILLAGLAFNLGVLGYFKYANFGVATFNDAARTLGFSSLSWTPIVLPVGLSFYVLQSVSYLVDVRRGTVAASRRFVDYAAYKAMFAQLIAGPIVRYAEIADDLKHRRHTLRSFGEGARLVMVGFAMKVILADTLSPVAEAAFGLTRPSLIDAWTGAVAYTLQIYFDFAGYSTLAIGLALMMGFHFPRNFDNPYLAHSIRDFWQRWHITLSRFLRDYLYIPLGGNRAGARRTYLNLLVVLTIGGAWHGANWTFIVWGAWHGGWLALHRCWLRHQVAVLPRPLAVALTLLVVVLGWVVFRAPTLHQAFAMYAGMAGLNGVALSDDLAWQITPDRAWAIAGGIAVAWLPALRPWIGRLAGPGARFAGSLAAFALGIVLLYSRAAVPFLYFQF